MTARATIPAPGGRDQVNDTMIHDEAIVESESTAVAHVASGRNSVIARPVQQSGGSLVELLHAAVAAGTPLTDLKELVDLHERMDARQALRDFAGALAAFQQECPSIEHSKTAKIATKGGSSYSYSYAELDEIARVVNPILARHGLSYSWDSSVKGGDLTCVCTLRHVGGHSNGSSFTLPVDNPSAMNPQQKVGAALTFAQRRTLQSVLGITTTSEAPASEVDPTTIGEDQVTAIDDLITETKSDRAKFLKYMGVEKVQHIRVADYRKAITALETKKREAK